MDIVFKKRQLKLVEDTLGSVNNKPALAVTNSEGDNDVSSLRKDVEKTNMYNSNHNPVQIDTQSYTNKRIPTGETTSQSMEFNNTPQAASQIQQFINSTPANSLPKKIMLKNGKERSGNIVEIATSKKKELDKFLKSL